MFLLGNNTVTVLVHGVCNGYRIFITCSVFHSQKTEDEDNAPKSPDSLPPGDCFEMVSQVNWEDDIIWTLEDVKPNLQAQARAGWIPTQTTRTAHAYALQQEQLLKQLGMNEFL